MRAASVQDVIARAWDPGQVSLISRHPLAETGWAGAQAAAHDRHTRALRGDRRLSPVHRGGLSEGGHVGLLHLSQSTIKSHFQEGRKGVWG